jgi:hypothetical protein
MPLYSVTTQAGVLGAEVKVKLAGNLTTLHPEYSGVPKNWVRSSFLTMRRAAASRRVRLRQGWRSPLSSEPVGRRTKSAAY